MSRGKAAHVDSVLVDGRVLMRGRKLQHIDRDALMNELKKLNIGTGLHYKAIHHHSWYRENLPQAEGSLPNADYASDRILSLPLFPKMTDEDAADVVSAVKEVISRHRV